MDQYFTKPFSQPEAVPQRPRLYFLKFTQSFTWPMIGFLIWIGSRVTYICLFQEFILATFWPLFGNFQGYWMAYLSVSTLASSCRNAWPSTTVTSVSRRAMSPRVTPLSSSLKVKVSATGRGSLMPELSMGIHCIHANNWFSNPQNGLCKLVVQGDPSGTDFPTP